MNHTSTDHICSGLFTRFWRKPVSLFVLLAATGLSALAAESAATGSITGSVTSSGTRNALQGAMVSIPTLNRTVFTDEAGQFTVSNVPAGSVDVIISYTGFDESHQKMSVSAGSTSALNVPMKSSELVTMQVFTVESVKEGQALSLTQQRNAANIKNVTAFDEWGVLPTQNVAELLTRLPGIMTGQIDDDGLMMSVSIGGQPGGNAGYTRMNIDGMASTGVGGDGRTATMHSFSGSMYEQVEIIAGQTPDKRADGLGGQLNFITASPLAMSGRRRVDFTASGRWFPSFSERNDMLSHHALKPDLSVSYREVFDVRGGHRNLGIMVSAAYQEVVNPFDYDINTWQAVTTSPAWFQNYQRWSGVNDRFISAFNARVDYKVSDSTRVSLRFLYNAGSEPFFQWSNINPNATANISLYDPVTNPNGSIVPGFTATRTEIRPTTTVVAGNTVGGAAMRMDLWKVSFTSKNPTGTLAFDHNWGRLKVDHAYRWSQTHFDSGAGRNREGGELTFRTRDPIGMILDYSNGKNGVFKQTSGPSVYDPASYTPYVTAARNTSTQPIDQTSAVFLKRDSISNTNEVSATVNATYLLPTEIPITIKTGLDTVNRRVHAWVPFTRRWYGVPGSVIPLSTGLIPLHEFERENGGQRVPAFDPAYLSTTLNNPALWTEDVNYNAIERFRTTRIMEEGVDAAYLQGTAKFGRLNVLGGVRGEWVSTYTFFYTAAPAARRTLIATEPDPLKRANLDYTPSSTNGKYHKFFPSIHLAYDLTKNLKLRASWSNSYGRPRLQDMLAIPTATESTATPPGTLTIGNPDLRPAMAKNLDFRLDYSYSSTGFFSARVYRKDISDYVGSSIRSGLTVGSGSDNGFGGQYAGYFLLAPINLGSTLSNGFELDLRQRLTFLPGLLKGLTVRANYTNVRTSAVFLGTAYDPGQVVGSAGQWYIPRSYNVGLQYFYGKFGASYDVNYTAQFPIAYVSPTSASNQFRERRFVHNAGFTYQIRPEVTAFLNVNNLTEAELNTYIAFQSRHRQINMMPRTIKFGVTGRF